MSDIPAGISGEAGSFLRNLGFPLLRVHHSYNHFDFSRPGRIILVIGPMGSGKTEFSARMWRDGLVARSKGGAAKAATVSTSNCVTGPSSAGSVRLSAATSSTASPSAFGVTGAPSTSTRSSKPLM